MKILFVCLGNICRSPIAEGVLQKLIVQNNLDWTAASSGTNGYHTGEPPHRHSQEVCAQHGYDISKQRAKRFSEKDFDNYDKIYVMADDVYRDVEALARNENDLRKVDYFLNVLFPGENRDVTDPWYGDKDGYLPVFQEIEKAVLKMIKEN